MNDVADAVLSVVLDDGRSCGRTYELGGPEVTSVLDLVNTLIVLRDPSNERKALVLLFR